MQKAKTPGLVIIVIGGNMGSEGKGRHVEVITRHGFEGRHIDAAVRTGAPNAGHSVTHQGTVYALQTIPCSWINPDTELYIGAGGQIEIDLLVKELSWVHIYYPNRKIFVDEHAIFQTHAHMKAEQDLKMHAKLGSTAEGCGEALMARIRRDGSVECAEQWNDKGFSVTKLKELVDKGVVEVINVAERLNKLYDEGKTILLEGTQGAGLSLYHTPDFGKATSRDTNAANWLAEAGLSPMLNISVHMVMRSFPIRVAGKSGYLPSELTWPEFLRITEADVPKETIDLFEAEIAKWTKQAEGAFIIWNDVVGRALDSIPDSEEKKKLLRNVERTTVTKKVRRIAKNDLSFYKRYLDINRPSVITLQFGDYLDRKLAKELNDEGEDLIEITEAELFKRANGLLGSFIEAYNDAGYPLNFIGFGRNCSVKINR